MAEQVRSTPWYLREVPGSRKIIYSLLAVLLVLFVGILLWRGGKIGPVWIVPTQGQSMCPTIHSNDRIVALRSSRLKKGDIVLFRGGIGERGNTLYVKRVASLNPLTLVSDNPVDGPTAVFTENEITEIIGKVVCIIPWHLISPESAPEKFQFPELVRQHRVAPVEAVSNPTHPYNIQKRRKTLEEHLQRLRECKVVDIDLSKAKITCTSGAKIGQSGGIQLQGQPGTWVRITLLFSKPIRIVCIKASREGNLSVDCPQNFALFFPRAPNTVEFWAEKPIITDKIILTLSIPYPKSTKAKISKLRVYTLPED